LRHNINPTPASLESRRVMGSSQLNCLPFQLVPSMTEVLQCLKKHGQRLDSELAKETGVPIAKVRQRLAELSATGAIITCNLTRFEHGKRIDGLLCRMSGWVPPPAPGRKTKVPA